MSVPATWICILGNNDATWRVQIPADALGAKVIKVTEKTWQSEALNPNLDGDFRWYLNSECDAVYPDLEGPTAVWTRPDVTRATHAIAMWDQGKRIVCEVDDNYLAPPKYNPVMSVNFTKRTQEEIARAFAPFDDIIVTTPYLRDVYTKAFRALGVKPLPEFHICGNHISPQMAATTPEPYDGPVRVGWMGSDSHWRDIRLAYPAFEAAAAEGAEIVIIGYDPKWWPQCGNRQWKGPYAGREFGFNYTHIPWVNPAQWERSPFPIDIGICPLERNKFTLGKSDVKVLDYALAGAAVVCSDTVYGDTIRHGETGLLVRRRQTAAAMKEMGEHVLQLVRDAKMRRELAGNLRQYVNEERVITQPHNLNPWKEAITP